MYEGRSAILMLGIIIVFASIMTCLFGYFISTHFDDTDKYNVSREYDVTGTVTESAIVYDCTGSGESRYINESGSSRIYVFTFDISYSESSKKSLEFHLFCDNSGVPLKSMYDKVSEDEGTSVWKYVADDGLTYLFTIGEYCKVSLMEITGDGLSLKATLKE